MAAAEDVAMADGEGNEGNISFELEADQANEHAMADFFSPAKALPRCDRGLEEALTGGLQNAAWFSE